MDRKDIAEKIIEIADKSLDSDSFATRGLGLELCKAEASKLLQPATGDRAEVIAALEGMVAMHEKNGGGRSVSADALRSAIAMLRAGAVPQVPPSDCANRGSCSYHRVHTDPPSNIYICHDIDCPHSVKAYATPGQEKGNG